MTCDECGLTPWDADDLQPGDMVCVCDDPFHLDAEVKAIDARDAQCWKFGCALHLGDRLAGS